VKECEKKSLELVRDGFSLFLSFGGSKRKKKIEKCNSMFRTVMGITALHKAVLTTV
jgi:hypothetical protein